MRPSLRITSAAEEPSYGSLMRMAARYGHRHVRDFSRCWGISFRKALAGQHVDQIAQTLGLDGRQMRFWTPRTDRENWNVHLAGEALRVGDWSTRHRRWCPVCLSSDVKLGQRNGVRPRSAGIHRAWWDLRCLSTCPDHRIRLHSFCPRCGKNPGWTGGVEHCSCGSPLWLTAGLTEIDLQCDIYVLDRIRGIVSGDDVPLLSESPLHAVLQTTERLGMVESGKWSSGVPRRTPEQSAHLRERGFRSLREWPHSFHRALDRIVATKPHSTKLGMIASYGWIYDRWATESSNTPFHHALRAALRKHAITAGVIAAKEEFLGEPRDAACIGVVQTARRLQLSFQRTRRIIRSKSLVPRGARRGVAIPIPLDEVDKLAATLRNGLNCKAAVTKLGINKKLVRKLAQAGLLDVDRNRVRPSSGSLPTSTELTKFIDSIMSLTPRRDVDPLLSVTLIDAAQFYHVPFEVICIAIQNGHIQPCGLRAKGTTIADVLLYREDVKLLQERATLSLQQTATALEIHFDAARDLVRLGSLPASARYKRQHYRIHTADINNFRQQYVTGKEAGRILGIQSKCVGGHLRRAGVRPAISPPLCRQTFYTRSEITRIAGRPPGTNDPSRAASHSAAS
ncbi:TniQ family protein [Tardiphaga sp. 367_B4_N1_1]|uniref:TniQ family protein n=1 Tax=Tardiphaga sp. 367_B4_N1_1 TaxID=3240777 RepID=UPI003F21BF52